MNICIIIPARYESTRLRGKPLIDLVGIPMIVRTYKQCIKAFPKEHVYVATESIQIKEVCEANNINVIMTSENCLTGTDRVFECTKKLNYDFYINVQGDEPLFNPDDIKKILLEINKYPNEILNGYCEILDETQYTNYSIPKVVMNQDKKLLYMSRAAIPSNKKGQFIKGWRQVCIYGFPKEALVDFSKCKTKTTLENIEDIEILRFLELGWDVRMVECSTESIAVDNLEDVKLVEQKIREKGL